MKPIPRISDTEWEIMRIIWANHPLTGNEVIAALTTADPNWHPKTVRTLLARLVRKKALGYKATGRIYVYSPLLTEHECMTAASESFLGRVFGGSLRPMLAHFVEKRKVTLEDLEEMKKLLEKSPKSAKAAKKHGDNPH